MVMRNALRLVCDTKQQATNLCAGAWSKKVEYSLGIIYLPYVLKSFIRYSQRPSVSPEVCLQGSGVEYINTHAAQQRLRLAL